MAEPATMPSNWDGGASGSARQVPLQWKRRPVANASDKGPAPKGGIDAQQPRIALFPDGPQGYRPHGFLSDARQHWMAERS